MADERNFELEIITPDRVFWKGEAYMLELNTSEGEVGIYKRHIPMTMIVEPGILTIHLNGEKKEAAVHAGFIEVLPEKITVMAEIAEWPEEIDANRAKEAQERALRRIQAHDPKLDLSRAELALRKAIVRQELAKTK